MSFFKSPNEEFSYEPITKKDKWLVTLLTLGAFVWLGIGTFIYYWVMNA